MDSPRSIALLTTKHRCGCNRTNKCKATWNY